MIKHITIIFSIFFVPFFCNGQNKVQKINPGRIGAPWIWNYTSENYQANPQNWAIIQDDRGVMHFGNTDGVISYNTTNWGLVGTPNGSLIRSMDKKDGIIYLGAKTEFGMLGCDSTGKNEYVTLIDKVPKKHMDFTDIHKIIHSNNAIYFVAFDRIFIYKNDTIDVVYAKLNSRFASSINNKPYFYLRNGGIATLIDKKLVVLPHTHFFNAQNGRIMAMDYPNEKMLICSEKFGFFIYDIQKAQDRNFRNISRQELISPLKSDVDEYIRHNKIYSNALINDTTYAIGTVRGGIVIINHKGQLLQVINENRGLYFNTVLDLYVDNFGNLWAGLNRGISYIEYNSPVSIFDKSAGIDGSIYVIKEFENTLYIGTTTGVYYLPQYELQVENDKNEFKGTSNYKNACWALEIINGHLIAGTVDGIFTVNKDTVEFITKFDKGTHGVFSLGSHPRFPNHLFIGLRDGFAALKIKENGKLRKNIPQEEFIHFKELTEPVRGITLDSNNNFWLSTVYSGIGFLSFNSNNLNDYEYVKYDTAAGLPFIDNNNIKKYKNSIKILTRKGIYRPVYNKKIRNHRFVLDSAFNFLNLDTLSTIDLEVDSKNNLWLANINGLIKSFKEDEIRNYKYIENFKLISTFIYDTYIDQKDFIWIGTSNGIIKYNAEFHKDINIPFNTLITKATLNMDSVIFHGTYYNDSLQHKTRFIQFKTKQNEGLKPIIHYKNNNIIFKYASLYYEQPYANDYSFKLEGFDNGWSKWSKNTKKEYTNLPEGRYTFKVRSKNIFEKKSSIAEYSFKILSPWYRTWLAYAVYIVLSVLFILLIIYLNNIRQRHVKRRLEKIIKERTKEIVQKNREITGQYQEIQLQKEEILVSNEAIKKQNEEIQSQAETLQKAYNELDAKNKLITTQAANLEKANQELQKLSIVASETDNLVLIMDKYGVFEWANPAFEKFYGDTLEAYISRHGNDILSTSTNPNIKKIINYVLKFKKTRVYQSSIERNDGKLRWLQTTLTPIVDKETGEVTKIIAIDADITKMRDAQQKINKQNKLITDSIVYAQTIQEAILPIKSDIDRLFHSFIVFKPKDIVSGDFYWFAGFPRDNEALVSLIDCTGHGVPGAFMSMIGNNILHEFVMQKGIRKPSQIVQEMNRGIIKRLKQDHTDNMDGMDLIMCRVKFKGNKRIIHYCGASRPLIYYSQKEKELFVDKGWCKTVGGILHFQRDFQYTEKTIELDKGDIIYLTSDGYVSQMSTDMKKYGSKRFFKLLENVAPMKLAKQKETLEKEFAEYKLKLNQYDDVTIWGIKL